MYHKGEYADLSYVQDVTENMILTSFLDKLYVIIS